MIKKQYALALAVLLITFVGGLLSSRILAAQSARNPPPSQQPPSKTNSADLRWEYRVLYYDPRSTSINGLEGEINRLSEQGYEVDSFQPMSTLYGSGRADSESRIEGSTSLVLILRRQKR